MSPSLTRTLQAARRLLPALVLLAVVAVLVPILVRSGVTLTDSASARDYGAFALGLAAAYLATRLLDFLLFDVGFRLRRGTPAPALLRQLVGLLVFGVLLVILFKVVLSVSLPALLTTSAIITAVVGLALQETLGNLFSGIALALERTVQVGDMIRSEGTIGLVEQLSWRAIKTRTMEGHTVLIPNSMASRNRLEVFRRGSLPMARTMTISLDYETSPGRAHAALEAAARDLHGVAALPAPVSYLVRFHDFAIEYELRYWLVDYAHYLDIDSRVRERVWYQLEREGIPIAYPLVRQRQWTMGQLPGSSAGTTVLAAIASSPLFAPLSEDERLALAKGARLVRFGDAQTIVREGDAGSSMFLIATGRAAVSVRGDITASRKLAVLGTGDAFGEISLLTGDPRLATVRAVREAVLVEIDKATLAPVLFGNPSLVEKLEEVIRQRRRDTAEHRAGSGSEAEESSSLRGRIARFFGVKGLG